MAGVARAQWDKGARQAERSSQPNPHTADRAATVNPTLPASPVKAVKDPRD